MSDWQPTCPVTGNPDIYGLGIRIGIYIQMFTVQISGLASAILKTEDYLGQGTIIFVLATGIALINQINIVEITPVEVFPILTLLLAQVGVCRVPFWKGQTTALIYVFEVAGMIALFVWYWWHGMDTLPRTCVDDHAWFFAKVSIWNWFRKFNKAGSILFAIGGSVTVLFYLGAIIAFSFMRAVNFVRRFRGEGAERPRDQENPMNFGPLDFFINIGAIVYVEMALKWNGITNVHDVSSPGQFMPLFIALAQFISVFYGLGKSVFQLAADDESDFGSEDEDDEELECPHAGRGWYANTQPEEHALAHL